jgi:ribosomal protein S21
MGVRIVVGNGESIVLALKRLKKKLETQRINPTTRSWQYFTDSTQERRAKRFQKRFKARRATLLSQQSGIQPVESLEAARIEFWRRTGKP